jgi:hypothetical protein
MPPETNWYPDAPELEPGEIHPFTQYLSQAGLLGSAFTDPSSRYMRRLYDPLKSLFGIHSRIGSALGPDDFPGFRQAGDFENYLGGMRPTGGVLSGGLRGGIYSRAANLLSSLYGIGAPARELHGLGFSGQYDPDTGTLLEGSSLPQAQQKSLLSMALAPRMGRLSARMFANRLPQFQQLWESRKAGGQIGSVSFLDWLNKRFNLTQYLGGTDPGNMATGPYNQPIIPRGNPTYIPDPGSQYDQSPELATRITEAADTTWMAKDIKPANYLGTAKEWWDDIPDANGMRISDYPNWVADQRFGESAYGNPDDLYGIA